jgi:peptidoglycan hydrolase-like protein with peptidoglycan-binding domain
MNNTKQDAFSANAQNREWSMPPFPEMELRIGINNEYVRDMQRCLNKVARQHPSIGLLTEDGIFGSRTLQSVKAFQSIFGLEVDGIVGMITWVRLAHECGRTKEPDLNTMRLTARDTLIFLTLQKMLR